ncbi:MAG TPA: hypothetical protein VIK74_09680, partial [Parasegetibacter sp.]
MNSDAARIIFPAGLDSLANDIASLTQFLSVLPNAIDSGKKKKINIVLQNQTLQSNGYVGLAPFRSEFYISPRQNSFELGSIPWHQTLTLHEFRHVQQFNQFNRGLSSFARIFLGEEGQALLNSASVPDWFFEGDAVFFETRYSRQGRGNLPFFFNDFRSLWKEGRNYSFMKLRNGSYKHFVPDHYALGYLLVSYGRTKFGDKFWNRVTEDAAAFKYPIYPFQSAFKKQSGQNYRTFVNEALEYFRKEMLQNEMLQKDSSQNVSGLSAQPAKAEKFVTDYLFPYPCGIDSVLVLKKSYRSIPAWYIIHQGIEKKIAIKDISLDDYYSFKNGKIIYTSYTPSARWAWHDFSNICILDISSGSRTTVSSRSKYFSPDISEDGNSIVAVNQSPSGKNNLHILDAKTGNLIKELPNTQNFVYTYPKFYGNDDYVISSVRTAAGKMGLLKITLNSGAEEWIAGPDMK